MFPAQVYEVVIGWRVGVEAVWIVLLVRAPTASVIEALLLRNPEESTVLAHRVWITSLTCRQRRQDREREQVHSSSTAAEIMVE